MKISASPAEGLHIEVEEPGEWHLLTGILRDAQGAGFDLATQVGGRMDQTAAWNDWEEYVIPDIRAGFLEHLKTILMAIESARLEAAGGPGLLWITREDAFHWYSALNQARLAIEASHHLGPGETIDPNRLSPASLKAFIRSQFYCAIQSILLDQGLG
ncbi:MAG: hypothetical protein NTW21_21750 [Verrucomicrobia bacterium]|nr:hypothetical protein [Verrucomicrobiota bacterium]